MDGVCAKAATAGIADERPVVNGAQGGNGGTGTLGDGHPTGLASRVAPHADARHSVPAPHLL